NVPAYRDKIAVVRISDATMRQGESRNPRCVGPKTAAYSYASITSDLGSNSPHANFSSNPPPLTSSPESTIWKATPLMTKDAEKSLGHFVTAPNWGGQCISEGVSVGDGIH